jgi:hypothetical protein
MGDAGFIGIVYLLGSAYSLWQAWLRLKTPNSRLLLFAAPEMGSILFIRVVRGTAAAARHRAGLMRPERVRRSGYYYLLGGVGLAFSSCLAFAALFLQLRGP